MALALPYTRVATVGRTAVGRSCSPWSLEQEAMSLLTILIGVVLAIVILWAVNACLPHPIRLILNIVVIVGLLVVLLSVFGKTPAFVNNRPIVLSDRQSLSAGEMAKTVPTIQVSGHMCLILHSELTSIWCLNGAASKANLSSRPTGYTVF